MNRIPGLFSGQTLFDRLDERRNSLNAIRLALAVMVIVSHSWPVGGYGADPGIGGQSIGDWSVAGFFAISGFLITGSRLHSRSVWDYFWRRILRIYPAFITVLVLVAVLFAPVSVWIHGGSENIGSAFGFIWHNADLIFTQSGIDGTLQDVPWKNSWDGPLWTLSYEFLCYIAMGLLVTLVKNRRALIIIISGVFVACTGITSYLLIHSHGADGGGSGNVTRLGAFFAAGALLYLGRRHIRLTPGFAAIAGVALIAIVFLGWFKALGGAPAAYLLMYAGVALPLSRIGAKNDISYGMYIYAWPIQEILATAFPNQILPVWVFVILSIGLTIPFAWASWLFVERQAMKLKRLTARRKVDREGHVIDSSRRAAARSLT